MLYTLSIEACYAFSWGDTISEHMYYKSSQYGKKLILVDSQCDFQARTDFKLC